MLFEMQGNIWQTVVGWGNLPYKSWFVLPKSTVAALSYVFEVLEKQGQVFRSKYGKIPTVKHLIRLTKRAVNDGSLNIVLVSSEGRVVPTVKTLAEKSRLKILYVRDISEKEAFNMLKCSGFSENLSQQLLSVSGPRLQYIKRVQTSARICGFPGDSDDSILKCVKAELLMEAQDCIRQARAMKAAEKFLVKKKILQHVLKSNADSMSKIEFEVCKALGHKKFEEVHTCMEDLLHGNVLTIEDDKIKFHSRLLKIYVKKFLETNDERPIEL